MTDELIVTIVFAGLTLIFTAIGWGVTSYRQGNILKETRKAQVIDRDLAIHRERMKIIGEITDGLIDASQAYLAIAALAKAGALRFSDEDAKIIKEANENKKSVVKTLYNAEYRTLRDYPRFNLFQRTTAYMR